MASEKVEWIGMERDGNGEQGRERESKITMESKEVQREKSNRDQRRAMESRGDQW